MIKELGLGKWVERPTPVIGDNQNSITWAKEDMMADRSMADRRPTAKIDQELRGGGASTGATARAAY